MSEPATSTPLDHPAIHKLDVARDRLRDEVTRLVEGGQYAAAISAIHRLEGVDVAIDCLLAPDECFAEV